MKEKATTLAVQRLVIVLAVLAVLGQIASHEFVGFDDPNTIYRNPRFNPPTVDNILYYWSHDEGLLYIPVTYTAWGLVATVARVESPDVTGSSQNPWLFHALNVLLHLGAALLVFEWLRVILRVNWPACVGALVFALHPLQVETVAWASGTKD